MGGDAACMFEMRRAYKILKGRHSLGRLEDDIRTDLKEIMCEDVELIHLA
jgi:hypothetical protein